MFRGFLFRMDKARFSKYVKEWPVAKIYTKAHIASHGPSPRYK
jgi:hypothetical protein